MHGQTQIEETFSLNLAVEKLPALLEESLYFNCILATVNLISH
jgi:hypothetical protein